MSESPSGPKRAARFRVLARDNFTCQYCGRSAPDVKLEVDHIIARSRGGSSRMDNLITACFDCNQGKKAMEMSAEHIARLSKKATERPRPEKKPRPAKSARARVIRERRPEPIKVPVYDGGAYIGHQPVKELPVSDRFVYTQPDVFLGAFVCQYCGFVNTYEGDHCSCRKRRESAAAYVEEEWTDRYCDNCGDEVADDEYDYCDACREELGE